MEKIIIYEKNGEILIVANADNADLLSEYVGLLTKYHFHNVTLNGLQYRLLCRFFLIFLKWNIKYCLIFQF